MALRFETSQSRSKKGSIALSFLLAAILSLFVKLIFNAQVLRRRHQSTGQPHPECEISIVVVVVIIAVDVVFVVVVVASFTHASQKGLTVNFKTFFILAFAFGMDKMCQNESEINIFE